MTTRRHELFTIGPEIRGTGFVAQRVDYAAGYRRGPHWHEETGITLVVDGSFRETACGREELASALSVVVKPAGTVHEDVVGPRGARTILVEIPDAAALLGETGRLGPWRWLHAGPGVRPLLALGRALGGRGGDADEAVLELLGEVADVPGPRRGDVPDWVRRAREALDDLAPEGLRVDVLAAGLGVHPVSLTRAFRRAYGLTVTAYRRRQRLRRAAARMVETDEGLGTIAHAGGFADQAHMCREVRAATGLTASSLRDLARG
jgi:AraC family transcriptional regulator